MRRNRPIHPPVRRVAALLAVAGALLLAPTASADTSRNQTPVWAPDVYGGYRSDQVVVRLAPGVAPQAAGVKFGHRTLDAAAERWGVTKVEKAYALPFGNPERAAALGLDRWYLLHVPARSNVLAMIRELNNLDQNLVELAEVNGIGGTADVPNDPSFATCWGQNNTGQSTCAGSGTADADVDAVEAWDTHTGEDSIVLGLIDSGIQNHVDLAGKILPGWNTVLNNTDVSDASCPHGTHVAGTAGAIGDNGIGVAGMSWGVKILPIKVLTGCGGTAVDCGEGIIWGADNGANVETMSLQYYDNNTFQKDACTYAWQEGVLVIAATGNGAGPTVASPANFPDCMGIGATTLNDGIAGFSNTGPETDLSAPGQDVNSLVGTNGYGCLSGTSMATPHASGTACLVWSYAPSLTNDDLKALLRDTTDDKGAPGYDTIFGTGRLNAQKMIEEANPGLGISLSGAAPKLVPPNTPVTINAKVKQGNDTLVPGSEKIFYRDGAGAFIEMALTPLGGELYEATLPGFGCDDNPEFYVQAEGQAGGVVTSPKDAPTKTFAFDIGELESSVSYTQGFNAGLPAGWTATGLWKITGLCASGTSCDGGTYAYYGLTNNCTFNNGGANNGTLTSPPIALPAIPPSGKLELQYCYRYAGEGGNPYDRASVIVNGVEVATASDAPTWTAGVADISAFAGANATLQFKFDTVDGIINDTLGWQVDGLKIVATTLTCESEECYADCDENGILDIDDFVCFQTFFAFGDDYADCDGNGVKDVDDFICFQTFFALGCP
jgi:hypothetical protein